MNFTIFLHFLQTLEKITVRRKCSLSYNSNISKAATIRPQIFFHFLYNALLRRDYPWVLAPHKKI